MTNTALDPAASNIVANIDKIYDWLINTANRYLHLCSRHGFPTLQREEDPSFDELAQILIVMSHVIGALSPHLDQMQVIRAREHCQIMVKISEAIKAGDQVELDAWTRKLGSKPGVI
jgi:hypothetical protein